MFQWCSHHVRNIYIGVYLDQRLNFTHYIKEKVTNSNKGIAVIKKLQTKLPWNALLTIYKSFIRPHLDYAGIIYDQPNNDSFKNKLERIQYNNALAITATIRGTSRDKIYKELGLESLQSRRSLHHLCTFHKIKTSGLPSYFFKLIPDTFHHYLTRSVEKISTYQCRTESFKSSFFP